MDLDARVWNVKQHLNGFTFGRGLEYVLAENLAIGAPYDILRRDGQTNSIATTGAHDTTPYVFSSHQVDINAVTLRLSLKLGQSDFPVFREQDRHTTST